MRRKIAVAVLSMLMLAACTLPVANKANGTTDPNVAALQTQAVATVYAAALTAASPIVTSVGLTPTPTGSHPAIRFDSDTNCRTGPGIKFELVAIVKAGQTAEALGAQSGYWVIKSPTGSGMCWVVADFATPSGNVAGLPKMTSPPTYTPQPVPLAPSLVSWDYSCEFVSNDNASASTITTVLNWLDKSDSEISYDIYRNDELVASLAPNSTTYTDVTTLAYGDSVTYFIQVSNHDGAARSKSVTVACK